MADMCILCPFILSLFLLESTQDMEVMTTDIVKMELHHGDRGIARCRATELERVRGSKSDPWQSGLPPDVHMRGMEISIWRSHWYCAALKLITDLRETLPPRLLHCSLTYL